MNADSIAVSWDEYAGKWLVRIQAGEKVIRRHSEQAPDIDHATLQVEAIDIASDEGYTFEQSDVKIL